MEKQTKILICPDVHSRTFWKIVKKSDLPVIFLGDYLDPYDWEGYTSRDAINNFKEILEFKKNNSDRAILLIGNHDAHIVGLSPDTCRLDFSTASEAYKLYKDNESLFRFAYKWNNTIFTHAGITTSWLDYHKYAEDYTIIEILNNQVHFTDKYLNDAKQHLSWDMGSQNCSVAEIGYSRGGDYPNGSPIWADVREMMNYPAFERMYTQIFGHTQLENTGQFIHQKNWYMCDSRAVFEWDGENFKLFE